MQKYNSKQTTRFRVAMQASLTSFFKIYKISSLPQTFIIIFSNFKMHLSQFLAFQRLFF
jgi:hypothetical protein